MKPLFAIFSLCLMQPWLLVWAGGGELSALVADRTAVERIYHNHRTGEKAAFEQAVPAALIESLVQNEARKEAVLKKHYSIEVTPEMLEAEVRRIRSTTRAPEVLEEITAALGNDPARFARCVARPIVVENLLRSRFQDDASVHGAQRREVDEHRARLLAAPAGERLALLKKLPPPGVCRELPPWLLTPRQVSARPVMSKTTSGRYSVEASASTAPSSESPADTKSAFLEDLPAQLQQVLRAQLQQAGDVSAVIETPTAFMLYLAQRTSPTELQAAVFTTSKHSYDEWLTAQQDPGLQEAGTSTSREPSP